MPTEEDRRGGRAVHHPDFLVRRKNGTDVLGEVKADSEGSSEEVVKKREAARRYTPHASTAVDEEWECVLVKESEIKSSKGSAAALIAAER